jgi:hypothetical protein
LRGKLRVPPLPAPAAAEPDAAPEGDAALLVDGLLLQALATPSVSTPIAAAP